MSSRRSAAQPRPTALGDVLEGARRTTLQRSRAALDRETWRRAVGRRIAERTEVGQLRSGELTIYVASAAWAQELSLLTREILERLPRHGVKAERVRFRVKPELGRPAAEPQPVVTPPARPLPAELDARLGRIEDDTLRAAIGGAAALALSRLASAERAKQASSATSTKRAARSLPSAERRSDPKGRRSAAASADPRHRRAKSSG